MRMFNRSAAISARPHLLPKTQTVRRTEIANIFSLSVFNHLLQLRQDFVLVRACLQSIFTNLLTGGGLTMSLKLTENTARFSAARKKIFREIATFAARIVYDDLAARCRSLAPVR